MTFAKWKKRNFNLSLFCFQVESQKRYIVFTISLSFKQSARQLAATQFAHTHTHTQGKPFVLNEWKNISFWCYRWTTGLFHALWTMQKKRIGKFTFKIVWIQNWTIAPEIQVRGNRIPWHNARSNSNRGIMQQILWT